MEGDFTGYYGNFWVELSNSLIFKCLNLKSIRQIRPKLGLVVGNMVLNSIQMST